MYVNSSDPLPQNGLMPPPDSCAMRGENERRRAQQISNSGRRRAYGTVPSAISLVSVSPGAAGAAGRILPQSELARRSILTGGTPALPPPTVRGAVDRPKVVPLNWVPGVENAGGSVMCVSTPVGLAPATVAAAGVVMPDRAPNFTSWPWRVGGMEGYNPKWGDAAAGPLASSTVPAPAAGGLLGWIRDNPWLAVGLAGVGVAIATQYERGRR